MVTSTIITDEELKIYEKVKQLVGARYDEPTIIKKVQELKDAQMVVNSLGSSSKGTHIFIYS
jgi:hypothetical protein